ncbi:MAG TPA: hypothetical protein VNU97_15705 [Rhizomicrobium sp.]|jgi:hypothetical protein|nr:hypothetical protein [Rhizomicrobium sp.]
MPAASRLVWRVLGVPVTAAEKTALLAVMIGGRSREAALDFMRDGASHNTEKSGALLAAQAIFVVVGTFALDHGWPRYPVVGSMLLLLAGAMTVMANLKGTTGMYSTAQAQSDPVRGVFEMVLRRSMRFNLALYLTYVAIGLLGLAALTFLP